MADCAFSIEPACLGSLGDSTTTEAPLELMQGIQTAAPVFFGRQAAWRRRDLPLRQPVSALQVSPQLLMALGGQLISLLAAEARQKGGWGSSYSLSAAPPRTPQNKILQKLSCSRIAHLLCTLQKSLFIYTVSLLPIAGSFSLV